MENKLVHVYEHDDMKQLDYEKKLDIQLFHIMDKNTVLYKEEKKCTQPSITKQQNSSIEKHITISIIITITNLYRYFFKN